MPAPIYDDPFKRYEKRRVEKKGSSVTTWVVGRNGQFYYLNVAQLLTNQQPNHVEKVVQNLLRLTHPAIINIFEVYIWNDHCYWLTEKWIGGPRCGALKFQDDDDAEMVVGVMQSLTSAIRCMHEQGIVHGSLSLEDIHFFRTANGTLDVKITNLGIDRHIDTNLYVTVEGAQERSGCPPEAYQGCFSPHGDVWSIGVAAFHLLTGHAPTVKRLLGNDDGCMNTNESDELPYWVPPEARDFLVRCLQIHPEERMTSEDATRHPWLVPGTFVPKVFNTIILKALQASSSLDRFKRLALSVLAKHMDHAMLQEHREAFKTFDISRTGFVEYEEFQTSLDHLSRARVHQLFDEIDFKQDGRICFAEFMGATLQFCPKRTTPDKLKQAFDCLDHDGDGFISASDMANVLDMDQNDMQSTLNSVMSSSSSLSFSSSTRSLSSASTAPSATIKEVGCGDGGISVMDFPKFERFLSNRSYLGLDRRSSFLLRRSSSNWSSNNSINGSNSSINFGFKRGDSSSDLGRSRKSHAEAVRSWRMSQRSRQSSFLDHEEMNQEGAMTA